MSEIEASKQELLRLLIEASDMLGYIGGSCEGMGQTLREVAALQEQIALAVGIP